MTSKLLYKNITFTYSFSKGAETSVVWDRQTDRGKQRQNIILTHNFFSWPYLAVLSSRPCVFSSEETYSTGSHQGDRLSPPPADSVLYLHVRLSSNLALNQDSPKLRPSRRHRHISFRNTHTFPINHVTASAYFHICVLLRESPSDSTAKGQYESIIQTNPKGFACSNATSKVCDERSHFKIFNNYNKKISSSTMTNERQKYMPSSQHLRFRTNSKQTSHSWTLVQELLFTNPSARAGYDTRSIFKRSLTGFEFRVFLLLD